MNCHLHTQAQAVATCSQGCGRGLCSFCTQQYEPPTCAHCVTALQQRAEVEVEAAVKTIKQRMVLNVITLVSTILAPTVMLLSISGGNQPSGGVLFVVLLLYIPMFIWGWQAFLYGMAWLSEVTGLTLFIQMGACGALFFGAMICGSFCVFVIPVQLYQQWEQLQQFQSSSA